MTIRFSGRDAMDAENSYALVPAGDYIAEVKAAIEKVAVSSGRPYLSLEFMGVDPPYQGRTLCFDVIVTVGDGFGIGVKKLRALGVPIGAESQVAFEADELRGRRVRLTLVEDTFTKADGTVIRKMKPVFDREKNFGYQSLDGSSATEVTDERLDCTCAHGAALHPKDLACSVPGCACAAFEELPF